MGHSEACGQAESKDEGSPGEGRNELAFIPLFRLSGDNSPAMARGHPEPTQLGVLTTDKDYRACHFLCMVPAVPGGEDHRQDFTGKGGSSSGGLGPIGSHSAPPGQERDPMTFPVLFPPSDSHAGFEPLSEARDAEALSQ